REEMRARRWRTATGLLDDGRGGRPPARALGAAAPAGDDSSSSSAHDGDGDDFQRPPAPASGVFQRRPKAGSNGRRRAPRHGGA
ncbi:unnamed protein product, partial [Urochloa humidicola]